VADKVSTVARKSIARACLGFSRVLQKILSSVNIKGTKQSWKRAFFINRRSHKPLLVSLGRSGRNAFSYQDVPVIEVST
jgi:hypothetical protein